MGTGSSREVETPRRLSLTNSPVTRRPRYDYTRPSNHQNGHSRPIWTPSPPPRQPRYLLIHKILLSKSLAFRLRYFLGPTLRLEIGNSKRMAAVLQWVVGHRKVNGLIEHLCSIRIHSSHVALSQLVGNEEAPAKMLLLLPTKLRRTVKKMSCSKSREDSGTSPRPKGYMSLSGLAHSISEKSRLTLG